MGPKRISTIGSATQDIFMLYEGAETLHLRLRKKETSFLLLEQGTKIDISDLHYASGGGATNTAVSFKRLGLDVEVFFKIGADSAGQFIQQEMLKEQVSTAYAIVDPQAATAISFIIPSIEHNQVALVYRGANNMLFEKEFSFAIFKNVDYAYIGPLSGQSKALLPVLATYAQKLTLPVATNPSINQIMHEPDIFLSALPLLDILIMNAYEAAHLIKAVMGERALKIERKRNGYTEKPHLLSSFLTINSTTLTLYDYFQEILARGPRIAVVTNGAEGVYVATKDILYYHPSLKADAITTLGAGDAFSACFVAMLLQNKTIEEAIVCGVINAWSVIQSADAKQGLLTIDELEKKAAQVTLQKLQTFSWKK